MSEPQIEVEKFTWLINNFVAEVPGVTRALVVSSDGLSLAVSAGFEPERAEQLSAVASGLLSLAQGVSHLFDQGAYERTIVRMEQGYLLLTTIAEGCCFAVLAGEHSDTQVVSYQMAVFVEKTSHVLTPTLRSRLREAAAH